MTRSTFGKLMMTGALLGALACGDEDDKTTSGTQGDAGATEDSAAECPSWKNEVITAPVTECLSYQTAEAGMCAGFYCKLNEEQLTPMISSTGACGGDAEFTCRGTLTNLVGACARKIKGANPTASNCELRPMIEACAYEDAEVKEKVNEECLGCFLDAAECAGDNCLVECLTGDSQQCDACRLQHNCIQTVFTCGGLPNPFAT